MTVNTTQLSRLLPLAVIAALSVGACGGPAATDATASRPDIQVIVEFQQNRLAELQASQNGGSSKLTTTTPAVTQAYQHYHQYCGIH